MSVVTKGYLLLYNVVQTIGWSCLLAIALSRLTIDGLQTDNKELFAEAGHLLKVFQTAAVLEIAHAVVGLVRSNPMLTAFQVYSRVFITWAIVHSFKSAQSSMGFPLLLLAWSITEIIRYSYYALNLVGISNPPVLTWLRYTLFIVLYPVGVTGEIMCQLACLPEVRDTETFFIKLPNAWNFGFDFGLFIMLTLLMYVPIFPQLYLHMFGQRKKILGASTKSKNQ